MPHLDTRFNATYLDVARLECVNCQSWSFFVQERCLHAQLLLWNLIRKVCIFCAGLLFQTLWLTLGLSATEPAHGLPEEHCLLGVAIRSQITDQHKSVEISLVNLLEQCIHFFVHFVVSSYLWCERFAVVWSSINEFISRLHRLSSKKHQIAVPHLFCSVILDLMAHNWKVQSLRPACSLFLVYKRYTHLFCGSSLWW